MAKLLLDGKLECAVDCPFGNYDHALDRTFCKLSMNECTAESALNHSFNITMCDYVTDNIKYK